MTRYTPNLCRSCALLRDDKETCEAFPRGIPDEIRLWGADHTEPVDGDRGVTYRRARGERARQDYSDWADGQV